MVDNFFPHSTGNNSAISAGKSEELKDLPSSAYNHCQADAKTADWSGFIFYFQFRHYRILDRIFIFGGRDENDNLNHRGYIYSPPNWREIGIQFAESGRNLAGCLSAAGEISDLKQLTRSMKSTCHGNPLIPPTHINFTSLFLSSPSIKKENV